MEFVADILLASGALGAGFYCFVLSRRLAKFNNLENGMGGAVAVLSAQVDDLTRTLEKAKGAATTETDRLEQLTAEAEAATRKLELLMASMHDIPSDEPAKPAPKAATQPVFSRTARGG